MGSARNGRKGETKGTRREGGMEGGKEGRKERRVAVKMDSRTAHR